MLSQRPWTGAIHRYRSPLRPLTVLAGDEERWGVVYLYDPDQVGPWTPDKIYSFGRALPEDVVNRLDLVALAVEPAEREQGFDES